MSKVVIYHGGGCPDGFTAAWAVWKKYPDAEFIGLKHSEQIPENLEGKDVIMVDFSFKEREDMIDLKEKSNSFILLDHHQSAVDNLQGLEFDGVLDMNRSGASLAWDYFHDEDRPWLIDYIEYRDLGYLYTRKEHSLPSVNEILLAVDSRSQTFEEWDVLQKCDPETLIQEGSAIKRYKNNLIDRLLRQAYEIDFDGEKVMCVNTPLFQSEIGNRLAQEYDFSLTWFHLPGKTKFSLRSKPGKADVCKKAMRLGGGGHVNAAGFSGPSLHIQDVIKKMHEESNDG